MIVAANWRVKRSVLIYDTNNDNIFTQSSYFFLIIYSKFRLLIGELYIYIDKRTNIREITPEIFQSSKIYHLHFDEIR